MMTILSVQQKRLAVMAAVVSGLLGVWLMAAGGAATFAADSELEDGGISGQADIKDYTNASEVSGGQTVIFGTSPDGQAVTYGSSGNGNPRTDDCTVNVQPGTSLQQAVSSAANGAVVCVKASDWSTTTLSITKAVTVRANGQVKLRNVVITGAGTTLDGFTVVGGAANGISLNGTNHKILNNYISGRGITTGILCDGSCGSGHMIAGNTVTAIHNYGIYINNGDNVSVERNNVYDLWMSTANGDVDAMRLWGTNHKIRQNYFHDINEFKSAKDSGGDTPHVDCWQSFQTGDGRQLRNVLIENNYCVRISRQCMILSNHLTGTYDIRDITFRGNVCETYDSSVVNLGSVAGITLENNFFLGGVKAQVLTVDYTREENPVGLPDKDIRLRNNIVMKGRSDTSYFYQNSTRTLIDNTDNVLVLNTLVNSNATSFQSNPNQSFSAIKPSDFTAYRQLAQQYEIINQGTAPSSTGFAVEIDGGQRVLGGAIDIGPFEVR